VTMITARGLERPPDHSRGHVQHVNSAQNDSQRRQRPKSNSQMLRFERAENGQELRDKSVQPRQADAAEREEDEKERQHGHLPRQSGELIDIAGVIASV